MPDRFPEIERGAFGCCAVALALFSTGCFAPHGMAPLPLPSGKDSVLGELSGGYGVTTDRSVVRTDLGASGQLDDWLALELRGQYLHVEANDGTDESGARASRAVDAFQPYLRPAIFAGPVTVAIPVSGLALGAGGGGVMAGVFGVSLGVGGTQWNVFSGVQWQGSEFVSSNPSSSSAREICLGARYALLGSFWRLSIDPQVVVSSHRFASQRGGNDDHGPTSSFTSDRSFVMGLMQLSVAFGDLMPRRPPTRPLATPESALPSAPREGAGFVPVTAPTRPSACSEFCRAQARLPCGIASIRCQRACERRFLPAPCGSLGDALLRCEASELTCSGAALTIPPCAALRAELDACVAIHPPPRMDAPPCEPDEVCDHQSAPATEPTRRKTKSLGEVPE